MPAGTIFLVATPIGNLEDITLRALRVLREADLIACEDTRRTGRLLSHFRIERPLLSCHEHNEARRAAEIVTRALEGESVAVVSDAGTPAISDPGLRVVRTALDAGVRVTPIPGPNAAVAALAVSGLPSDGFRFGGFLPRRKGQRRRALEAVRDRTQTTIFFEAPHRILETMSDIEVALGDRQIVLARELTKLHEELLRGSARSIAKDLSLRPAIKGEFVVLIGPGGGPDRAVDTSLPDRVKQFETDGMSRMDAIKRAARERGLGKREAYARLLADSGPKS